jgi:DNA polymerase III epsilon subunit
MAFRKTFLVGVAAVSLLAAMVTIIWLVAFWHKLTPAEEALFTYVFFERYAGIFLAAFLLLCALGLALGAFLHYYLIPLRRLVEETSLIATVNPLHRISPSGSRDLSRLAETINDGADRFQNLREQVDERIRLATKDLISERNTLAAVIGRLHEGVVVCNLEGRITMYNGRARELLSSLGSETAMNGVKPGFIGLGRFLFDVLDRNDVTNALRKLQKTGEENNSEHVCAVFTTNCSGRSLNAIATPLPHKGKDGLGYFFTLRETANGEEISPENHVRVKTIEIGRLPYVDALSSTPRVLRDEMETVEFSGESWRGRPEFFDFRLFNQIGKRPDLEDRFLEDIVYTAFDTETTGLYPSMGDEIIAIGAVRILNGRILREESFHQLVDPKRFMRAEAVRIHGITAEMLKGKPPIEEVIPRFHKFSEATVLIAHNAAFDMKFLELKEPKSGIRFENPVLDTLLLSLVVHPNQSSHSLEAIADLLGIEIGERHMALADALLAGEVFLRLLPLLKKAGVRTLKEALIACEETSYAQLKY